MTVSNHRLVCLLKGASPIPEDGRIKFETNPADVVLNCHSAKKSDEGKYNVTLKNSTGSTSVTISVLVMGKIVFSLSVLSQKRGLQQRGWGDDEDVE